MMRADNIPIQTLDQEMPTRLPVEEPQWKPLENHEMCIAAIASNSDTSRATAQTLSTNDMLHRNGAR